MKKREGLWFTIGRWIVERLFFRGYHLAKMQKKRVERKLNLADSVGIPAEQIGQNCTYPKAGE